MKFESVFKSGVPRSSIEDERRIAAVVALMKVRVPTHALPLHAQPLRPEIEDMPPMWQIAALRNMGSHRPHC